MTTQPPLEHLLKELGWKTPLEEIPQQHQEIITTLLATEKEHRTQHKIARLLKQSGIKQVKTFSQFDWHFNPKIAKEDVLAFSKSPWIEHAYNLALIGDTGLGKTHIARALCYEAILKGHTTIFITAFDLITKITRARNPEAKIDYYAKTRVLAIDEVGYTFLKREDTDVMFQVISKRTELYPTIVTTNLPPKQWGSIFSGSAASAILDRLSYNGKFLTFEGRSYRLLKKHKSN